MKVKITIEVYADTFTDPSVFSTGDELETLRADVAAMHPVLPVSVPYYTFISTKVDPVEF